MKNVPQAVISPWKYKKNNKVISNKRRGNNERTEISKIESTNDTEIQLQDSNKILNF